MLLDAESEQIREVYAYFGLAMYQAQNLERQLAMLLAVLSKTEMSTAWDYDARLAHSFESTFGTLVTQFGEIAAPEYTELDGQLETAVESRNDLAHHYFWDRAVQFSSTSGREDMLEELRTLVSRFESLDQALTRLTRKVADEKGLSEEKLRIHAENSLEGLRSGKEKVYRPERVPNPVEITGAYEWRAGSAVKSGLILKSKGGHYLIIGEKGLCYGLQDIPTDELVVRTEFQKALPAVVNPRPKKSAPWTFAFPLANGYVLNTRTDSQNGRRVCRFAVKRKIEGHGS
jgi:hypothetical protein